MTSALTPRTRGYLEALGACAFFSFMPLVTKVAYQYEIAPRDLFTLRLMASLPVYGVILLAMKMRHPAGERFAPRLRTRDVIGVIALAVWGVLPGMALFESLYRIDASLVVIIVQSAPTIVAVLAIFVVGEALTARKGIALAITYVGIVMAVPLSQAALSGVRLTGVAFGFATAAGFAVFTLGVQRLVKGMRPLMLAACMATIGVVVLAPFLTRTSFEHPPTLWLIIAVMGVFMTVAPAVLMFRAIDSIGASRFTIIALLAPVLTVIWAHLWLGERLAPIQLAGGAVVVLGVAFLEIDVVAMFGNVPATRPTSRPDSDAHLDKDQPPTDT